MTRLDAESRSLGRSEQPTTSMTAPICWRVAHLCAFCKGGEKGVQVSQSLTVEQCQIASVPSRLKRYYGTRHLHFLTCSCYHRQPWSASARRRDPFLPLLEQVRKRYVRDRGLGGNAPAVHLLISDVPAVARSANVATRQRSSRPYSQSLAHLTTRATAA